MHAADCRNQWTEDENTALEHAVELARTGVEIALGLPDAHWVLGYVYAQRRRHDEAIWHLDQALAVSPTYADAYPPKAGSRPPSASRARRSHCCARRSG